MNTLIVISLCVLTGALFHLRATTRAKATIDRLLASLSAERAKRDDAERDLEFERLSNPSRINWSDPKTEAGLDRIVAAIKLQALEEQLAEQNGRAARVSIDDVDVVIDLRDGGLS
jgi:hypothetical protein